MTKKKQESLINRVILSNKKNFRVGSYRFQRFRLICTDERMEKILRKVPWDECELCTIDGKRINPLPEPKKSSKKSIKGTEKKESEDI